MAEEQINVDITASDKASDKLEDVADLVEDLEEAKPEITVEADTKAAAGDLEQLSDDVKALDKLTPTVDVTADTGTADGDLRATRDLAEALAKADAEILVRAKIDDAKANLKELRGELDRLNSGGPTGGGPITGATIDTDNYTASTGKAKDATHNFVGSAITELPGIGPAFGPAAEGIGALTEGVLAGEIAFKQLAIAGGAIAAVTIIAGQMAEHQKAIAETKAWRTDALDGYVKALREGESAAEALAERLAEAGKVEIDISAALGIDSLGRFDIAPIMAKNGIEIGTFTEAVVGGAEKLELFRSALEAAGVKGDDLKAIMFAAEQQAGTYETAQEKAAIIIDVFGTSAKEAAVKATDLGDESKWAAQQLKATGDNADDAAPKVDRLRGAYEELIGELSDRSAYYDVEDAFANLDAAAVTAFTAVQTNAADADQAVRDHKRSVDEVKQAVADYALEVGGLPAERLTSIAAQIDRGEYQKVLDELAALEVQRQVILKIVQVTDDRGYGPAGGPTAPRTDTVAQAPVNVYMPTGSTGTDVLRVLGESTRRSGDLFGGP